MKKNNQPLVCDVCGKKGARVRKVTEACGKGKDLLIIEDVPMASCPNCGESFFTAETLHGIERIRIHRGSFAEEKAVEVASFA
jgi:YgiT-type zinc finger domain-containing protein